MKNASTTVVTGAARGLGRALAELSAGRGDKVIMIDRDPQVLTVAQEIGGFGVVADLSTAEGTAVAIAAIDRSVNFLFLNAAATRRAPFRSLSPEAIEALLYLNVVSPTLLASHFARMPTSGGRNLILISSSVAGIPTPFLSMYGPAKAYLSSFGAALWREEPSTGLRTLVFELSGMRTSFQEASGVANPNSRILADPKVVAAKIMRQVRDGSRGTRVRTIGLSGFLINATRVLFPRSLHMRAWSSALGMRR